MKQHSIRIIRISLTLALIAVMFTHVHWSVGLFGLISLSANEFLSYSQRFLIRRYKYEIL